MPRDRRYWAPGSGAHTISRFVDRRFCLSSPLHREVMLDAMARAHERWDWHWLSWALMSSHTHLGHLAGQQNPDRFTQSVNTRFALAFHKHADGETLGPVYAGRPRTHIVEPTSGALLRMVAYQHRNPPDANVVSSPRESRWTSHRAYLRIDPAPPFLDVEWALSTLGFADTAAGRRHFDEYVTEVDLSSYVPPAADATPRVRRVIRASTPDIDWSRLLDLGQTLMRLPSRRALFARRGAAARWVIAKVATCFLGQTLRRAGEQLKMQPASVSNLLSRRDGCIELHGRAAALRDLYLLGDAAG